MAPITSIALQENLFDAAKTTQIRDAFTKNQSFNSGFESDADCARLEVIAHSDGFPLLRVQNIFTDDVAECIRNALNSIKYNPKHIDLYQFQQSDALVNTKNETLLNLSEFLASETMMEWVQNATGVNLISGKVDVAAQRYCRGDRLLCHDDDITEDENSIVRRIAFILYFVDPSWNDKDGGQLQIFGRDEWNQPKHQVLSEVIPQWNSLALFEVTPTSYHQVAEILSATKTRLSITGWFYGPLNNNIREKWLPKHKAPIDMKYTSEIAERALNEMIAPIYLQSKCQQQIKGVFCEQSQIELKQFLSKPFLKKVQKQLNTLFDQGHFEISGPANLSHFQYLKKDSLNGQNSALDFFVSRGLIKLFEEVTCLNLSNPSMIVRCFQGGDYTLVHDDYKVPPGLDVHIFLTTFNSNVIYLVDENDTQDVVKSDREENKALFVLRDDGVTFFSEYIPKTKLRASEKVFDILLHFHAEFND